MNIRKILNALGIYGEKQVKEVKKKLADTQITLKDFELMNDTVIQKNKELTKESESAPYEFDNLIGRYNKDQLNAFVYKAINHARNTPEKRVLLDMWENRIRDAKESLGKTLEIEIIKKEEEVNKL